MGEPGVEQRPDRSSEAAPDHHRWTEHAPRATRPNGERRGHDLADRNEAEDRERWADRAPFAHRALQGPVARAHHRKHGGVAGYQVRGSADRPDDRTTD